MVVMGWHALRRGQSPIVSVLPPQLRPSTVMPKPPLGPSRLSHILKKLKTDPRPVLTPSLKSLKLAYAVWNDHFGARCVRHFVEELPRIRYANPTIAIEVSRIPKAIEDTWQSSLLMEFGESLAPPLHRPALRGF